MRMLAALAARRRRCCWRRARRSSRQSRPIDQALQPRSRRGARSRSAASSGSNGPPPARGARPASSRAQQAAAAEAHLRGRGRHQRGRRRRRAHRRARSPLAAQRLAEQQGPVASAARRPGMLARRPPLLALASGSSIDELVHVRAAARCQHAGDPHAHRRAVGGTGDGHRLERAAALPRQALARRPRRARGQTPPARPARSARRCARPRSAAARRSAPAMALAEREDVEQLPARRNAAGRRPRIARRARAAPGPRRPPARRRPDGPPAAPPLAYRLPVAAPVITASAKSVRQRRALARPDAARRRGAQAVAPRPPGSSLRRTVPRL